MSGRVRLSPLSPCGDACRDGDRVCVCASVCGGVGDDSAAAATAIAATVATDAATTADDDVVDGESLGLSTNGGDGVDESGGEEERDNNAAACPSSFSLTRGGEHPFQMSDPFRPLFRSTIPRPQANSAEPETIDSIVYG